jgi:hypothetical protein
MADEKKEKLDKKKCEELYEQTLKGSKDVQTKAREVCERISVIASRR